MCPHHHNIVGCAGKQGHIFVRKNVPSFATVFTTNRNHSKNVSVECFSYNDVSFLFIVQAGVESKIDLKLQSAITTLGKAI